MYLIKALGVASFETVETSSEEGQKADLSVLPELPKRRIVVAETIIMPSQKLLNPKQAADYLGISYWQLRRIQHLVPHVRMGRGWRRYWEADLKQFAESYLTSSGTVPPVQKDYWS